MTFFLIIGSLLIVTTLIMLYSKSFEIDDPPVETNPVIYTEESMFSDYSDILKEIENCVHKKSLDNVYIRILIFHGSYPHSTSYLSALLESFHQKEIMINSLALQKQ